MPKKKRLESSKHDFIKSLKRTKTYKNNYSYYMKTGETLLKKIQYDTSILFDYYDLKTDNLTTSFGFCCGSDQIISASNYFLSHKECTNKHIKHLLLHEISHALTNTIDEKPHGPKWKAKFKELLESEDNHEDMTYELMCSKTSRYRLECTKGCVDYAQKIPKTFNLACTEHEKVYKITNNYDEFIKLTKSDKIMEFYEKTEMI
jgi:hypothetical protein